MVMTTKKRLIAAICGLSIAIGGEISRSDAEGWEYFSELSYYQLKETINGRTVLTEKGALTKNGFSFDSDKWHRLSVRLSGSADIGVMDYDGFRVNDMTRHGTVTSHLGTTEEVRPALEIPLAERVTLVPQATLGHTWYLRTASSEYWNILYVKGGAAFRMAGNGYRFMAAAGAKVPLYTAIDIDWSESGFDTPFTLRPKGEVTPWGEVSVENSQQRWKLGLVFDQTSWRMSNSAPVTKKVTLPTGAIVQNCKAFQPDTDVLSIGISFSYRF